MMEVYFYSEQYEKYNNGYKCKALIEKFFNTNIKCTIKEEQIEKYSKGGLFVFIKGKNRD